MAVCASLLSPLTRPPLRSADLSPVGRGTSRPRARAHRRAKQSGAPDSGKHCSQGDDSFEEGSATVIENKGRSAEDALLRTKRQARWLPTTEFLSPRRLGYGKQRLAGRAISGANGGSPTTRLRPISVISSSSSAFSRAISERLRRFPTFLGSEPLTFAPSWPIGAEKAQEDERSRGKSRRLGHSPGFATGTGSPLRRPSRPSAHRNSQKVCRRHFRSRRAPSSSTVRRCSRRSLGLQRATRRSSHFSTAAACGFPKRWA